MKSNIVKDYMSKNFITARFSNTVEEVENMVVKYDMDGFPVVENGEVVGFISILDILFKNPKKEIKEFMSKEVVTVDLETKIDQAARIMFRRGLSKLPVLDKKKIVGIISNTDILMAHIEESTEEKLLKIKETLEKIHNCKITIKRERLRIDKLTPSQHKIAMDELEGRIHEFRKSLVAPIVVARSRNRDIIIDGHHRVIAAKKLGMETVEAQVLVPDKEIEFGFEKTANSLNLKTIDDIEIVDDLVE